ncbi:protein phosphatase 2C domain-containing protein [Mesorhizobium sp. LHD-90]|uniref:PP2C family protein-serine/threonine phosphatase n=1 Tax=Mesorhizobium sp. LHD-90 TaxID=3071414 RepID=UPI0027DF3975|nr:protein phosphatase 2C domain-containing protein [Mesorhizobium sp. LHD-90]MDQ6434699.1 protein phosphatase 2C domain-containing protein [Mesorhizobium sp. LHD-90]
MNDPGIRFESFGVSHPGRVRQLNEDRFLMAPRSGLWLVADGMGGHDAGDVASSCIVAHMATLGVASSAPDLRARFEDRIGRANAEIRDIAEKRGATIGATMAALLTFERQFACLWIGDSRVYLIRDGRITQLSHDHTEVQELLDRGVITAAEARVWPRRNVITRAVGVDEDVAVDMQLGHIEPGDVFVVGSDGLTAHASDFDILAAATDAQEPEAACKMLLDTVLERGGTDNVTIVVIMCRDAAALAADVPRVGLRHGE